MKYHKIRGVALDVCTKEQKIAYNIAFRLHISSGDAYKKIAATYPRFVVSDAENQLLAHALHEWTRNGDPRLDVDAIFSALRAGLHEYLLHPFIAADYETVGNAFPALYLEN